MPDTGAARRALWAGLLLLTVSAACARLFFSVVQRLTPPRLFDMVTDSLGRARAVDAAIPDVVASPGPVAVMLGTSSTVFDLLPEVFDRRMRSRGAAMTTFNLGLNSVTPSIVRWEARRLRDACRAKNARLSLCVIEFGPPDSTEAYARRGTMVLKLALLMDWRDILALAGRSPSQAARLALLKAFGGLDAGYATKLLWKKTEDFFHPEEDTTYQWMLMELESQGLYRPWDPALRGGQRVLWPLTAAEYPAFVRRNTSEASLRKYHEQFIGAMDIEDLHFSADGVADFIDAVKTVQQVCDRTVIVVLPKHPLWMAPSPAGRSRLSAVLARLRQETGAPVLDFFDDERFEAADFLDLDHLNEITGQSKFSEALADALAPKKSPSLIGRGS